MTNHRFTVNVPNPSAKAVTVQLHLQPAQRTDLAWLPKEHTRNGLEVLTAGLSLEPCAKEGKPTLKLKLEPYASIDVHVLVTTAAARKPGIAGFHLVDERKGMDPGGVFLVCMDPPFVEPAGQLVDVANPCPATLATGLYAIAPGEDPSQQGKARAIVPGEALELVAQITNPTGTRLKDVQVYLEHLGASNLGFTSGTWNVGNLDKGDVFYATWPVFLPAPQAGSFQASIVVTSQGKALTRLQGSFALGARRR